MRAEYYDFSMRQLMGAYAKLLYEMSPGNKPFRADDIMAEAREAFQSHMVKSYYHDLLVVKKDKKCLYDFFSELLKDQPGFNLLNYTKVQMRTKFSDEELATTQLAKIYEVMQTVPNDGFRFSSMYSKQETTQEEWDNDFIDLDAFIGNFTYELEKMAEPKDCFYCTYEHDKSVLCTKCSANGEFRNYHKYSISWCKGSTVCNVGCPRGLKICCEDCRKDALLSVKYADCPYVCDDTPDKCNTWRFKDAIENPAMIEKDHQEEAELIATMKGEESDGSDSISVTEEELPLID